MENRILRLPQVIELTGFSRSSIYSMMQDGDFPLSIKLGKRAVGWKEEDINKWVNSRATFKRRIASNS